MSFSSTLQERKRLPLGIFVLGLTVFSLGTTEFMVAGLLPELSDAFGVSTSQAGLLIIVFALGVAIGAPLVTAATTRIPRRSALLGLLIVFIVGETVAAFAPTFEVIVVARIVTAVAHGSFFGIGAVVAADLAPVHRRAQAISIMFGGLTIATIAGVPLGTFLGQQLGWRAAFAAVAVLSLVDLVGVAVWVPRSTHQARPNLRAQLSAFLNARVWLALATTTLSQAGLYAAYTYIAPLLTNEAGMTAAAVPPLLALFGLGTFVGTIIGGRLADRRLMMTLIGGLAALATTLALLTPASQSQLAVVVALFAFGVAAFVINPALQTQVMNATQQAPNLASTANISAFNIGNALGPFAGGLGLSAGFGYLAPSWFGSLFVVAALAVALSTLLLIKSASRTKEIQNVLSKCTAQC